MGDAVRRLPGQTERVETGVTQFGDDWPGVFIRGDNAFGFAMALDRALETMNLDSMEDALAHAEVVDLRDLLRSCDARRLGKEMPAKPADAKTVKCSRCNEELDPDDAQIASTHQQWQCPCCGSWENKEADDAVA